MQRLRPNNVLLYLCVALAVLLPAQAGAATPMTLFRSLAGNYDISGTGGTFRASDDATDSCALLPGNTATATFPALPANASVEAAYLYYAASTDTFGFADSTVSLTINGSINNLTADRTFTDQFNPGFGPFDFYGGFVDITLQFQNQASSPGFTTSLSMTGLDIYNGQPHCDSDGVLGGFGVAVIYELPAGNLPGQAPLRVINVFDGFQPFRNSSVSLFPSNFEVPAGGGDGKLLVITWEGDEPPNGGAETLTFEGNVLPELGDPLNVGGVNDSDNDFNSTVSAQGLSNVYGVDVDAYTLDSFLSGGQTTAATTYGSGNDLVYLAAEIISIENAPVSDLEITKTHGGDFIAGQQNSWTLTVTNNGPNDENGTITVTDDVSGLTGITFVSAAGGPDWNCTDSGGGDVSCVYTLGLVSGASTPAITFTVDVDNSAAPSVTNVATVSGTNFDNILANNTASDPTDVLAPNLSTSTKVALDETPGDLSEGESVLYTITLTETGGAPATNVTVTDDLASVFDATSFEEVVVGSGTGVFDSGQGANGRWTVSNITVPANSSIVLSFRANVSGVVPGDVVGNTAVVDFLGVTTDLVSNSIIVDESTLAASGDKPLYFQIANDNSEGGGNDSADGLRRSLLDITGQENQRRLEVDEGDNDAWVLTPDVVSPLVIEGDLRFELWMTEEGNGNLRFFTIDIERVDSGGGVTVIGTEDYEVNIGSSNNSNPVLITLPDDDNNGAPAISISNETIGVGEQLQVRFTNTTTGSSNRRIRIWMKTANEPDEFTSRSKVLLPTTTVINVDSTGAFDAPITDPGSAAVVVADPGDVVYLRSVISDPFGDFDIGGATVTVQDANGAGVGFVDQVMVDVSASDPGDTDATKTFEVAYTVNDNVVPPAPFGPTGNWFFTVTAEEGDSAEGVANQIFDTGVGVFEVGLPDFVVLKSSTVASAPVNPTSDPKRIPGAILAYTLQVSNQGRGRASPGSIVVTDNLPSGLLRLTVPGSGLVEDSIGFSPGSSTLTFDFATNVALSLSSGTEAVDGDSDGCYDNVDGFTVTPTGQMPGFDGSAPTFFVTYEACIE